MLNFEDITFQTTIRSSLRRFGGSNNNTQRHSEHIRQTQCKLREESPTLNQKSNGILHPVQTGFRMTLAQLKNFTLLLFSSKCSSST